MTRSEKPKGTLKKRVLFALKALFSVAMLVVIFRKILGRGDEGALWEALRSLSWPWFLLAVVMQLVAIAFSTVRWQRLLLGQGIRAPWGYLINSMMIARFWGAFTPGGFTGFGGWRIYDVAKHTGKTARASATIGVELIMGQLAFGAVVMLGSVFGFRFLGWRGVLLVNGLFLGVITCGLLLLSRPQVVRTLAGFLPESVTKRVQTLVEAVCAYHGKGYLLVQAALLGVGTHAFNNLIYVCAARGLGVPLGIGEVFFGSSLQILSTLLPLSINGIGLRETTAVALYTKVGVSPSVAVLIPIVGFAAEMLVSSVGGLLFLLRRPDYRPGIRVEDESRESRLTGSSSVAPEVAWPSVVQWFGRGLSAGAMAGLLVGVAEAGVVAASSASVVGSWVFVYGAGVYALLGAGLGAALGAAYAALLRSMRRAAPAVHRGWSRLLSAAFALLGLALVAFRVRRDVFHELLVWKSFRGLGVFLLCAFTVGVAAWLLQVGVSFLARSRWGSWLSRVWGGPLFACGVVMLLASVTAFAPVPSQGPSAAARHTTGSSKAGAVGNVLVIVVDTLRADHLPAYGYDRIRTPNLDAFADEAVQFNQAFANASWTRPSFASLLTGRYPSSHGVMGKGDVLGSELVSMAEVFRDAGLRTGGVVTNYNVAPYFNFHQGFEHYHYLEPARVFGADDASAKLLAMQFVRQRVEKMRAVSGRVEAGTAYQDAGTVNGRVMEWIRDRGAEPWFLFVGYMDPHDPYFEHPYSGQGYARAANPKPRADEAENLRRLYGGEIEYWDSEFGKLVDFLKARGLFDDMTIVVTSDHGEEFHEHGGFWHGTTLYDEQIRVPLFVKLSEGRRAGTAVDHWVQSVDVMPTLLRDRGLQVPKEVQGGDLFSGTDVVFAEENHEGNALSALRRREGVTEEKLILANPGNPRGLEPAELYRVDEDPAEQANLARKDAHGLERMTEALITRKRETGEGAVRSESVEMDADARARLKALGYVSDGT